MKKHWKDLLVSAAPLIAFLERDSLFDRPYRPVSDDVLVIRDAELGYRYAMDDSLDVHDDWETLTDGVFPDSFEWSSWIDYRLIDKDVFALGSKNFNGADLKWTPNDFSLLSEMLYRDMHILLNCYSNEFFPDIWRRILEVYLGDGLPCGWDGRYPEGKLVVFSNF